jgi:hypothetical protein
MEKVGAYNPEIIRAQDYDLWWRVGLMGKLGNLKDIHLLLRLHEKRVSTEYHDQQLDSVKKTEKKYMSKVLGRDIPEDVIHVIRRKATTAQLAAMAGDVILDYCHYCIRGATSHSRVLIMRHALQMGIKKLTRFVLHPVTWLVWMRFAWLSVQLLAARIQALPLFRAGNKESWIKES